MCVDAARYDKVAHVIPSSLNTMEIYMESIDKYDKKTWRTIYKSIEELYFGEVKLFPKYFLGRCKKNPNAP